jgi:hypothetical protein
MRYHAGTPSMSAAPGGDSHGPPTIAFDGLDKANPMKIAVALLVFLSALAAYAC